MDQDTQLNIDDLVPTFDDLEGQHQDPPADHQNPPVDDAPIDVDAPPTEEEIKELRRQARLAKLLTGGDPDALSAVAEVQRRKAGPAVPAYDTPEYMQSHDPPAAPDPQRQPPQPSPSDQAAAEAELNAAFFKNPAAVIRSMIASGLQQSLPQIVQPVAASAGRTTIANFFKSIEDDPYYKAAGPMVRKKVEETIKQNPASLATPTEQIEATLQMWYDAACGTISRQTLKKSGRGARPGAAPAFRGANDGTAPGNGKPRSKESDSWDPAALEFAKSMGIDPDSQEFQDLLNEPD